MGTRDLYIFGVASALAIVLGFGSVVLMAPSALGIERWVFFFAAVLFGAIGPIWACWSKDESMKSRKIAAVTFPAVAIVGYFFLFHLMGRLAQAQGAPPSATTTIGDCDFSGTNTGTFNCKKSDAPNSLSPRGPHIVFKNSKITNATRDNFSLPSDSNGIIDLENTEVGGAGRDNFHERRPGEN